MVLAAAGCGQWVRRMRTAMQTVGEGRPLEALSSRTCSATEANKMPTCQIWTLPPLTKLGAEATPMVDLLKAAAFRLEASPSDLPRARSPLCRHSMDSQAWVVEAWVAD